LELKAPLYYVSQNIFPFQVECIPFEGQEDVFPVQIPGRFLSLP